VAKGCVVLEPVKVVSSGECSKVWTSREISPSAIPKLSIGNGLVYIYTPKYMDNNSDGSTTPDEIAWYFTAINFRTGETEFQILTSTGI